MTTQPDRQNEDGLPPCPLCLSNEIERGVCYAGDSKEKEPAVRCAKCGCRATLKAWNTRATRATQPARDGAEGADHAFRKNPNSTVDACALCGHSAESHVLARECGPGPDRRCVHGKLFTGNCQECSSAPPKPAPDALDNCPRCGSSAPHMHPAVQHEGEVELCTHEFHLRPTNQNTPSYIAAVEAKRARPAPDAMREALNAMTIYARAVVKFVMDQRPDGTVPEHLDELLADARAKSETALSTETVRGTTGYLAGLAELIERSHSVDEYVTVQIHINQRSSVVYALRLSAPAPPADGAPIIDILRLLGPPDPSDEEFEHGWTACNQAVVDLLTDLGFPGAGAAEPVEHRWRNHIGDFKWSEWHPLQGQTPEQFRAQFPNGFARGEFELQPLYATSPVRGEAIARALIARRWPHRTDREKWIADYLSGKPIPGKFSKGVEDAFADAIAILPLPFKPGAGEREAADQIIGDIEKRFPDWKSYRDLVDCIDVTMHNLRRGPQ